MWRAGVLDEACFSAELVPSASLCFRCWPAFVLHHHRQYPGVVTGETTNPYPSFLQDRALDFDYDRGKVRGVNLGGWLVLEPWITPSLFAEWSQNEQVKDEYTYTKILGKAEASSRLSKHWNTWITQNDFLEIKQAGLNHVRIPIGYWAIYPVPDEPFVQGQIPILDRAIGWARSAGLKVMIDLHGGEHSILVQVTKSDGAFSAPLSQNGFDNSGRYGPVNWQKGESVDQTLQAISRLTERYAPQQDVVTAIQLLNEPLGSALDLNKIKDFYEKGYEIIRFDRTRMQARDTLVVIHDAFLDFQQYWNGNMNTQSGKRNVMLDTHQYQIFTQDGVNQNPTQHVNSACAIGPRIRSTDKWTVVGEWTGAQTESVFSSLSSHPQIDRPSFPLMISPPN